MKTWQNLNISMLLTGSELIDGRLQDTNSLFVARFLFERGQRLSRIIICDDELEDIEESLSILAQSSDVIITSGGLGPTTGDRTREAISRFLKVPLKLDQHSLERIKSFFKERNRKYEANNDKQALIPESARVISNDYGTAACFSAPYMKAGADKGILFALPGVPRELEKLIPEQILPAILSHFSLASLKQAAPALHTIRIFGLGESSIGARVVDSAPDPEIVISYRATFPEVQVLFRAANADVSQQSVDIAASNAISKIGKEFVFSDGDNLSLVEVLHGILTRESKTIAFAESCSGGMLGSLITRMPGSSKYFLGSFVTYSNQLKQSLLDVPEKTLESFGAVSAEVARSMAEGARRKSGADIAISITGIAGPDGGSAEKPVGTCYLGLSDSSATLSARIFFPGSRERIREYTCYAALDLLRRRLSGLSIGEPVFLQVETSS